jgi:pyridinium-3,5-bisthiocarboxylic acid mononucleotide nickel chelatase
VAAPCVYSTSQRGSIVKALLYDCPSGISGDLNLGALVDLGVPQEHVLSELARLRLDDEFTLTFAKAEKQGITGTQATVTLSARAGRADSHPDHGHGDHHHHHHAASHSHQRGMDAHRHYRDIKEIIVASPFKESVKATTERIFAVIAEAEARVHGTAIDDVAFHEVGATDSIVDIFGAAICLDYLGVDTVLSTAVELGSGFVNCAHGRLAVPAPATLEILKGVPCLTGGVSGEATTPTGAAILKATVRQFGQRFAITPERIGYGIGHRDFAIPNLLRVVVGEVSEDVVTPHWSEHTNVQITANIDDMSPESYEPLIERLFSAGASDVFITPIIMKKSRLAHMISVLAQQHLVDSLVQVLFVESTTIGVRLHPVGKRMLARTSATVPTSFGAVQVKLVRLPRGGVARWKVEYEDVKRLALEHGLPYLTLRREIDAEVHKHFSDDVSIKLKEQE